MIKLVLDSNVINRCCELNLTKNFFDNLGCEIWIPTHVKNEVIASQKEELIEKLKELRDEETGFFGFSHQPNALGFGKGIFFTDEYSNFIQETAERHHNDRCIAVLSKINNAIFISGDKKAFNDAIKHNIKSLFFDIQWNQEEFKKALLQQMFV